MQGNYAEADWPVISSYPADFSPLWSVKEILLIQRMNRAKKTAKQSDRDSAAAYEKLLKVTKVISYKERLKKLKGVVLSRPESRF